MHYLNIKNGTNEQIAPPDNNCLLSLVDTYNIKVASTLLACHFVWLIFYNIPKYRQIRVSSKHCNFESAQHTYHILSMLPDTHNSLRESIILQKTYLFIGLLTPLHIKNR